MELTQITWLEWYGVFCLTTLICCLNLHIKAIRNLKIEFVKGAGFAYFSVIIMLTLLLAPIFFMIFIFSADQYYKNIREKLLENMLDNSD